MATLPTVLPAPRLPRLRGGASLRWGILAPGFIAGKFATALHRHTDQRVHAVGSRSLERGEVFARGNGVDRAYGSYLQLVEDPAIDAVYIASPHTQHAELAKLAIAAGKHVLIEKPLAVTAAQAREVAADAATAGVFAMEAMHTRFHPRTSVIEQLLADGVLGDIRTVHADLGYGFPVAHESRLYDPELAGGAILDLGVYSIWFVTFVLGRPREVVANGSLTETGVDRHSVTVMTGDDGRQGVVTTNMLAFTPSQASINGTAGRIHLDTRHPLPGPLSLYGPDNSLHLRFVDDSGIKAQDGLCRQAAWMAQHVADGLTDSPLHPLSMSIDVLTAIDAVRSQLGVLPHGRNSQQAVSRAQEIPRDWRQGFNTTKGASRPEGTPES